MQLHQPDVLRRLAALDAHLLVVSFAAPSRLSGWVPYLRDTMIVPSYGQHEEAVPADIFQRTRFVADPDRHTYASYGLRRNSVVRVYGPRILWRYLQWGLQGKPIRIREDTLQRGGDFVIGRGGLLTLSHTGRDQSDRPAVSAILAALGKI